MYLMKLITSLMLEKMMITISGFSHENQCMYMPTMHSTMTRKIRERMRMAVRLTRCPFLS